MTRARPLPTAKQPTLTLKISALLCALMCAHMCAMIASSSIRSSYAQAPDLQPKIKRTMRLNGDAQRQRIKTLTADGDKEALLVTLNQLVSLLLEDVSAELSAERAPLTIKGIGVRAPLSANLADWLEARVTASLHQAGHRTVFCVSCRAQLTTLSDEAWRLKQGLSSPQDIQQAARETGAKSLLDLSVGWNAIRNRAQLRARLYDAQGAQVWSRDYQNDGAGQPRRVARPGEPEGDSSDRYRALEDMYEPRDSDSVLMFTAGGGTMPSAISGLNVGVVELGGGWGERFGEQLRYRYALTLNLSVNTASLSFNTHLGGEFMARLSDPPTVKQGEIDTGGFWLGGGASLNYALIRQGVGAYVNVDWVSNIGLGGRVKGGYQFAFGDLEPDLSGAYAVLSILFLM